MGIAVGMHVVFLLLNALFRKSLKLDAVEQVNIIYSNAAALVIPIVQALLGEEYVVYSCAFVIVQLVLLWTHASARLQGSAQLEWRKLLTNVNLIAIDVYKRQTSSGSCWKMGRLWMLRHTGQKAKM